MKRTPNKNRRDGFTLVELIVVIAIIAALTTFSIPYFGGFATRSKLDSASREWMSFSQYARSQAVIEGVSYHLNCDLDRQVYWLTYQVITSSDSVTEDSPSGVWGKVVSIDSSLKISSITLNDEQVYESGQVDIEFTPKGTCTDALVVFKSDRDDEVQLEMDGVTGLVKVLSEDTEGKSL